MPRQLFNQLATRRPSSFRMASSVASPGAPGDDASLNPLPRRGSTYHPDLDISGRASSDAHASPPPPAASPSPQRARPSLGGVREAIDALLAACDEAADAKERTTTTATRKRSELSTFSTTHARDSARHSRSGTSARGEGASGARHA